MTAIVKNIPAGHELLITRFFKAPRTLVYKAWTDKEMALRWSGPRDYPLVESDHDVRPGGAWRGCLRGADGVDLWQGGTYREVVPNEKLVFTFGWDTDKGTSQGEMLVTITFADKDGGTEMVFLQQGFVETKDRDGHRGGWNSAFDRLAETVA
ncbi:hypothetical protein sos41_18460 [Alphaproteobacteria bacterium SO-S41]|nr:hypothetical protein sos41_18460 [Alphaproteobacteria bacterium SO-S41]